MLVQVTGSVRWFLCWAARMCVWRCRCAVLTSWQRKCLSLWDGIAAPWTDFTLLHFCGFCSVTGRSVGKPEKVQHQKCTEGGKKAKDSFRISENESKYWRLRGATPEILSKLPSSLQHEFPNPFLPFMGSCSNIFFTCTENIGAQLYFQHPENQSVKNCCLSV